MSYIKTLCVVIYKLHQHQQTYNSIFYVLFYQFAPTCPSATAILRDLTLISLNLMFATQKYLTHIQIYNDVSVKHNKTLLCLLLY